MSADHIDAPGSLSEARVSIGDYAFDFIATIEPERDGCGRVVRRMPQARYRNERNLPLNKHGSGPFCRFRIPSRLSPPGVYALTVGGVVKYVGECRSLSRRFNMGYGNISPRNCYLGGQNTNCKVNSMILQEADRGETIELWFHETTRHKIAERELLRGFNPAWNG